MPAEKWFDQEKLEKERVPSLEVRWGKRQRGVSLGVGTDGDFYIGTDGPFNMAWAHFDDAGAIDELIQVLKKAKRKTFK